MNQAPEEERPLDPEKLIRLAGLAREVLDEVRQMEPSEETSAELAALHKRVTAQLHDALPQALVNELEAIDLQNPFEDGATGQEVRIAYSGLIGWLGGLFQGLQAAIQVQALGRLGAGKPEIGQAEGEEKPKDDADRPPGRYL